MLAGQSRVARIASTSTLKTKNIFFCPSAVNPIVQRICKHGQLLLKSVQMSSEKYMSVDAAELPRRADLQL